VDEGTRRLSTVEPGSRATALEAEAAALRRRVDELLNELDRRETTVASKWALVRRYAVPALVTAALVSGAAYAVFRWREQEAWAAKMTRGRAGRLSRLL
jgi:hypothetical protein